MDINEALSILNKIIMNGEAWWVEDPNVEHIEIRISPQARGSLAYLMKEKFRNKHDNKE